MGIKILHLYLKFWGDKSDRIRSEDFDGVPVPNVICLLTGRCTLRWSQDRPATLFSGVDLTGGLLSPLIVAPHEPFLMHVSSLIFGSTALFSLLSFWSQTLRTSKDFRVGATGLKSDKTRRQLTIWSSVASLMSRLQNCSSILIFSIPSDFRLSNDTGFSLINRSKMLRAVIFISMPPLILRTRTDAFSRFFRLRTLLVLLSQYSISTVQLSIILENCQILGVDGWR